MAKDRDPDEIGARLEIVGTVQSVSEIVGVGSSGYQKFGALIDITKNPKYPESVEVEWFGKEVPDWADALANSVGMVWRFRGKAASKQYKDKWYTRVSIFWAGALSRQPERGPATPPPFDNSPIPTPPPETRKQYDDDEIPF